MRNIPTPLPYHCAHIRYALTLCCALWLGASNYLSAQVLVNIRSTGARSDSTYNSQAHIQRAIDSVAALGGGTVLVPNGHFMTGTLRLRTGVYLELAPSATLKGSPHLAHYDTSNMHLIYAKGATRTGIVGAGTINGSGSVFWDENYDPKPRPMQWIEFKNCNQVLVQQVTLTHASGWVLSLHNSDEVRVEGIRILNHPRSPNTDGIDITSSRNVRITGCLIRTGDDAICIKAARSLPNAVVENVIVTDCILESDDAAIKLGTGSAHTIRYCYFANNIIRNTRYGLALFMKDGGTYEHIRFHGIQIECSSRHPTEYPIFIDIDRRDSQHAYGSIRDIRFEDITADTRGSILVQGHPKHPIADVSFRNVHLNITAPTEQRKHRKPKGAKELPDADVDYASRPAHITLAHIRGLSIDNLTLAENQVINFRSVIIATDVAGAQLHRLHYVLDKANTSQRIQLSNCSEMRLGKNIPLADVVQTSCQGISWE